VGAISDADLLAAAIDVPGRLVLGPTTNSGGWPYGGTPIGVRTAARLEFTGRDQLIHDPMTGAFQYRRRREVEWPRIGFQLEPPWDQNALLAAFNATIPAASTAYPTPPETVLEGGWVPVANVAPMPSPLLFAPLDPRQDAVYFRLPVALISFADAIALQTDEEAGLSFLFVPALSVDTGDPGYPYVGSKSPWSIGRPENLVIP
jgi:hypothetical protein